MELALYCPVYGYYEKEGDTIGRGGDYYTNVSVGSLFGELLGCQFAEWLEECGGQASLNCAHGPQRSAAEGGKGGDGGGVGGGPEALQLVEAGAHRGELAGDILRWMREQRPALFQCLEYWIIEPSEQRQQGQRKNLSEFTGRVRWANNLGEFSVNRKRAARTTALAAGVRGIIFSNELLDAFPVHRLGWDANRRVWFEWGVALAGDRFVWTRMPWQEAAVYSPRSTVHSPRSTVQGRRSTGRVPTSILGSPKGTEEGWVEPALLSQILPDGFSIEASPAAIRWWRAAAGLLQAGKLMTIDYGLTDQERLVPERTEGTLRAYHRQGVNTDVLARPGEQDLTAHIDFSAIQRAGESSGLLTDTFVSQAQFLTAIAARAQNGEIPFDEWTAGRRRQFQTLTHPEHLGRAFRVLVQSRPRA